MSPVEKVAAALLAELRRLGKDGDPLVYVDPFGDGAVTLDGQFYLAALARVAIEAMREPSERMIDAGSDVTDSKGEARVAFENMIDAALAEGKAINERT